MSRHRSKHRQSSSNQSTYWMAGRHAVMAALQNDSRQISRALLANSEQSDPDCLTYLKQRKIPYTTVTSQELQEYLERSMPHQGMALQVKPLEQPSLLDVVENIGEQSTIIILDQVTDPQNIGSILRLSAAFSVDAVIICERNAPKETASIAKAASGGLETVPFIHVTNLRQTIDVLKEHGFWAIGLDGYATKRIEDCTGYERKVFILGSEGKGMRRLTEECCDLTVVLPMSGHMESLNVSHAAAIALYLMQPGK